VRENRVLLEQQMGSRWRGLWKLPKLAARPHSGAGLLELEYPFTHHRVTLSVHAGEVPSIVPENHAWHPVSALPELPLAAPHRRAIEQLLRA
jgi:A/G-specific adenine glycosylase